MDDESLSRILKAAGDTTRRKILTLLVQEGAMRVTALAAHFDMSLNSVSKHIKVLEEAGLVTRRTVGREHFIQAELGPLRLTEDWFAELKSVWELRLAALDDMLLSEDTKMSELELTVTRRIAAPREKVFDAWLAPATLARFMRVPTDDGGPARVETDPVKGGRFSIVMMTVDREVPHSGTYLEMDPHSRLAFTWESPHSLSDSVVTIDFTEPEPGVTDIALRQVKFRSEQARDGHREGWNAILNELETVVP